ncbi:MAG: thioesterase family protein [Homoserinimonas sp.]|nr:thioesterase family protein [Homoserinimonas sp.]
MSSIAEPFYRALGAGRFESSIHAQGAWNPHEQHMAPVTGLLTHLIERFEPRPELQLARLSFEILGLIPEGEFEVRLQMLRAGRTIELVQADLQANDRIAVSARGWRLQRIDSSSIEGIEDQPMPGPEAASKPWDLGDWPGGYIHSIEALLLPEHRPGRGRAWLRTGHPLLADAEISDTARLLGLADTSNGIATRVPPGSWAFPNVDLQIHLYREPRGEWLGLENSVTFGAGGVGLTSTVLHDLTGPFGRAEQILTLRPMAKST